MILECPSCSAKFKIPDGSIGGEGRRVRCGKCQHMWTAKSEKEAEAPEESPATEDSSVAPDIDKVLAGKTHKSKSKATLEEALGDYKPPKPVKPARSNKFLQIIVGSAYGVLTVIILCIWSLLEKPEWWGFTPTTGLAFERIHLEPMPQIGGERFTMNPLYRVTGTVRNISDKSKLLPVIRITLKDAEEKKVYNRSWHDNKLIPSGEAVDFVVENLEQADVKHTHFVVEMGNWLELATRSVEIETKYAEAKSTEVERVESEHSKKEHTEVQQHED